MAPVSQLGEVSWSVVCAAYCHMALVFAITHLHNVFIFVLLLSISFVYTFSKSGIDRSTEWSTIPACTSLMCFYNKGNTKGINSSKTVFGIWVCMFCFV